MKKWLLLPTLIFLIFLLSGCMSKSMEPTDNAMILTIKNNANFDFDHLGMSTYQNGEIKTTGGITNADGSKIKKGQSLMLEYIDQIDLQLEGEATFEFVIEDDELKIRKKLTTFTLELAPHKEYVFEISGNTIEEATLSSVN